jgi:MFS family permease
MLFWGMLLQGLAILCLPFSTNFILFAVISAILGLGLALVYPTFLSTIAQAVGPKQRSESIGTFRFWRDLGYPFGAILSGLVADMFGLNAAIILTAIFIILSAVVIQFRMLHIPVKVSHRYHFTVCYIRYFVYIANIDQVEDHYEPEYLILRAYWALKGLKI